jgi:hypothetical protein
MAFIGLIPCLVASSESPRTTKVSGDITAFDFDGIATNVRHCSFFHGRGERDRRAVTSCA